MDIQWGVRILTRKDGSVYTASPWCDWAPFRFGKPWSFNINDAYKVLENLSKNWPDYGEAVVCEYVIF